MTDLSKVPYELARLVTEQLVMRVVVCDHSQFPGCRIELMSSMKELRCKKGTGAFVHIKSEFYFDERHNLVDDFELNPTYYPHNLAHPFDANVVNVFDYWRRNVTPDSETPQAEWLQAKPFVGVLVARRGGSDPTQRLVVGMDARPLLGYYGLLRSQLSARAKSAAGIKNWNKGLEQDAEVVADVERRFTALFAQTQHKQFTRALEAI